jgi:hypothetical protein
MLIEGYTENVKRLLAQGQNVLFIFPHQYAAMDYFDLAAHYFRDVATREDRFVLMFSPRILLRGIIIKDRRDPVENVMRGFRGPAVLYPKPYDFSTETRERMIPKIRAHNAKWANLIKDSGVQPLNEEERKPWQR